MYDNIAIWILLIIGIEIIVTVAFMFMGMYKNRKLKSIFVSISKGLIERAFLTFGLISNLAVVIVFFSALKIGTRLTEDKESHISNDQFLVGNILSVGLSIIYYKIWLYFLG